MVSRKLSSNKPLFYLLACHLVPSLWIDASRSKSTFCSFLLSHKMNKELLIEAQQGCALNKLTVCINVSSIALWLFGVYIRHELRPTRDVVMQLAYVPSNVQRENRTSGMNHMCLLLQHYGFVPWHYVWSKSKPTSWLKYWNKREKTSAILSFTFT